MKEIYIAYRVMVKTKIDDKAYEQIMDDPGAIEDYAPDLKVKVNKGEVLNHEIVDAYGDDDEVLYEE